MNPKQTVVDLINQTPHFNPVITNNSDSLAKFVERFEVTDDMVLNMQAAEIIWGDILVSGHIQVWASKPNVGKTTIAMLAASELSSKYKIYFLQEDAGAGDLPALKQHANDHKYTLINSSLSSSNTENILKALKDLCVEDLSECIFIFDTLKKFAEVMNKRRAKEFFKLTRLLTTSGATVILLGHTNKHPNTNGKQVFEGVGDILSDVDEFYYLEKTETGSDEDFFVKFQPEKVRAAVGTPTFKINSKTRAVNRVNIEIDALAAHKLVENRKKDAPIIEAINQQLTSLGGSSAVTALAKNVSASSEFGVSKVRATIRRFSSPNKSDESALWVSSNIRANNELRISMKNHSEE